MYIKSLEIENIGPFRHFSAELTRGSIGIFGKNGAGKSTLLNLMYGLLTNEWRYGGAKADLVNNTCDAKAAAYVRGIVVGNAGEEIEIVRNFRTSKARPNTVVISRGETITTTDKAQEEIMSVLGVDRKMLDLYVFKEQDRIYDFLTSTPAERAQAYQVLCRTEGCASIYTMLHSWMASDREANTDILDNSDELTTEIAKIDADLSRIENSITRARGRLLNADELDDCTNTLHQVRKRAELSAAIARSTQEIAALSAAFESDKALNDQLADSHIAITARIEKRQATADKLRADLVQAEQYAACVAKRKKLDERLASLNAQLAAMVEPVKPDDLDKIDDYTRQLILKQAEVSSAKKVVTTFDNAKTVACPTCLTPVANLASHLDACREVLKRVPDEVDDLHEKIDALNSYQHQHKKYMEAYRAVAEQVTSVKASLESLSLVPAPEYERAASETWLKDHATLIAEEKVQAKRLKETQQRVDRTAGELSAKREQLNKDKTALAAIAVTATDAAEATKQLQLHREAEMEVSSLQGERQGCKQLRGSRDAELVKLRARLRRSAKVRKMLKVVGVVRDAMHWNNLPRRVATENLLRLEGDINANLKLYGSPFWVEPDTELSFVVHKPGEPAQPAMCLSTGQRVVLALAFWPAVASLWASSIGLLGLDEPTANLDTDNRRFLAEALSALTSRIRGNRQLIMVTHDHDLRPAFDQVIDIGA